MELCPGLKASAQTVCCAQNTAKAMGSGELQVFSTPSMTALMEKAAWTAVASSLPAGSGTVGTEMNISHISATPLGMKITAEAVLTKVENRKLTFAVSAYDEKGKIGEGEHVRFIIDNARFMAKADSKNS